MFGIQTRKFGSLKEYCLINEQSGEYVCIIPECGANIREMVLKGKDVLFPVIKGYPDEESMMEHSGYLSSRLLPFPNRIDQGRFEFNGATHQLAINRPKEGHAIHGLFYKKEFKMDRFTAGPHNARLELHLDYDGAIPGFPFPFRAELTFTLSAGGFSSKLKVINNGDSPMPFGDGWHPYFSFNGTDDFVDELCLKVPESMVLEMDDRKIPTGGKAPFGAFTKMEQIGDHHFDTPLEISSNGTVVTEIHDRSLKVTLGLWQETGRGKYNYLQIYIPRDRTSIAIEPMTCAPDAFNNRMGLIVLKPGAEFDASFGVYLT